MNHFIATMLLGAFLFAIGSASAADSPGAPNSSGAASSSVLSVSKQYESYEQRLEGLRTLSENASVVKQNARILFQMGKTAPLPLGDMMLEAACAALVVAGDNKAYKAARGALRNPRDFENSVLFQCPECRGARQNEESCRECRGTGRCPIPNCNGGSRYLHHVGNVPCPTCKGSGQCQDCNGSGRRMVDCRLCGGAGQKIDRTAVQDFYRDRIETAKNECRLHEVIPCRDVAGFGLTIGAAVEDALAKAVEDIHGPQAAESQRRLGRHDKTIVKTFKVKSQKESEHGDYEVKINALVVKVLQNAAHSGAKNASNTSVRKPSGNNARSYSRPRDSRNNRPRLEPRRSSSEDAGDPFAMSESGSSSGGGGDAGDPFAISNNSGRENSRPSHSTDFDDPWGSP